MKIALIGASGNLGSEFFFLLKNHKDVEVFNFDVKTIDITNFISISTQLNKLQPLDYIINCAAYTQVDKAEIDKKLCFKLNVTGPENLAKYSKKNNIILVHFSTDYVFDGTNKQPYIENDAPCPINYYGKTKFLGEKAITKIWEKYYIFRIQWIYNKYGKNFVNTILKLAKIHKELKIVNDQFGAPTWTRDLVFLIMKFLNKKPEYGIYHLANSGYTSWYEFTKFIFDELNIDTKVIPVSSKAFPTPAKRPHNSKLNLEKFIKNSGIKPRLWSCSLKDFLKEL